MHHCKTLLTLHGKIKGKLKKLAKRKVKLFLEKNRNPVEDGQWNSSFSLTNIWEIETSVINFFGILSVLVTSPLGYYLKYTYKVLSAKCFCSKLVITPTFHIDGGKTCFLNGTIRHKFHIQHIRCRVNIGRQFVTAVNSDEWTVCIASIPDYHVIVRATIMIFNLRWKNKPTKKTYQQTMLWM